MTPVGVTVVGGAVVAPVVLVGGVDAAVAAVVCAATAACVHFVGCCPEGMAKTMLVTCQSFPTGCFFLETSTSLCAFQREWPQWSSSLASRFPLGASSWWHPNQFLILLVINCATNSSRHLHRQVLSRRNGLDGVHHLPVVSFWSLLLGGISWFGQKLPLPCCHSWSIFRGTILVALAVMSQFVVNNS